MISARLVPVIVLAAMSMLTACEPRPADEAKPSAEATESTLSDVPPPLLPAMPLPENAVDNAVAKLDGKLARSFKGLQRLCDGRAMVEPDDIVGSSESQQRFHLLGRCTLVRCLAHSEFEVNRGLAAADQTEPQFVAEPLFRVTVGGEVERPSLYFFPPDVTVRQVVALAGGATERGRTDRVRMLSGGRQRTISLKGSDPEGNLPIRSGDQFIVESRGSVFRDIVAPLIAIAGSAAAIINVSRPRR